MSAIIIPEYIIHNTLKLIVDFLRKDLADNAADETKSTLYQLLGKDDLGQVIKRDKYIFFNQAKAMFQKKESLQIYYGFNLEVSSELAFHIVLPSESGLPMAIGGDEGYAQGDNADGENLKYVQMFESTYQIMITSSNQSEAMIIYHIMKAMLLMVFPHIELCGLRLPKFSGSDLFINQEYVPAHLFSKVINLSFNYELIVGQKLITETIKKLKFIPDEIMGYNP